jgi:hypothetical protein
MRGTELADEKIAGSCDDRICGCDVVADLLPPTWQYERLPNREPDWAIGRALQFRVPIRQSRDIGESRMIPLM